MVTKQAVPEGGFVTFYFASTVSYEMKGVVRRLKRLVSPVLPTLPLFTIFYCHMWVHFLTTPSLSDDVIVVWCIKYCAYCFCTLHFSCSWKIYTCWILSIVVRYCIFIFFRWVRRCVGTYVRTCVDMHLAMLYPTVYWLCNELNAVHTHAHTTLQSNMHFKRALEIDGMTAHWGIGECVYIRTLHVHSSMCGGMGCSLWRSTTNGLLCAQLCCPRSHICKRYCGNSLLLSGCVHILKLVTRCMEESCRLGEQSPQCSHRSG